MKALFTFCVCSFTIVASALAQQAAKTSRIRIHATNEQLLGLLAAGIDFDHGFYNADDSTYINTFDAAVVKQIEQLGFKVDILVDDVVAYTDSINRVESLTKYSKLPVKNGPQIQALTTNFSAPCQPYNTYITTPTTFSLGSMGGFYNLAELGAQIDDMVNRYPGLVSKSSIGNTLQGRPIWVVKISDNVATDEAEAEVLYTGMHHSREGMSMMNLVYFMRYILENYTKNPAIKEIIDNRELFFIPVVNIDGFNFNTTASNWNAGIRFRRKNMRETTTANALADGSQGDGVDINRNYGTYWGAAYETTSSGQLGSSGTGSSDSYRGNAAFSEPETQNMRDFVNGRNFKVALNYHCYGNWWIRPHGPDDVTYPAVALSAANVAIYNSIGSLFTRYNCYVYGTPKQTVYPVNGYSDDYLFSGSTKAPIFAFSPEIGNAADDFWCPQNKIEGYAKELVFPNLQAAYTAGSYAELQDNSDVAVTTATGTFNFTVTRKGLTDGPVTVTLIPLNNIATVGGAVTINSIASFAGTFNGSINYTLKAGLTNGEMIRYAWKLETGGITIRDTIVKIYNPTIVFSDNMETAGNFATKWTRAGTGSVWGYATGAGFNGTASLSESPSGNYSNSADQSVRTTSSFSLASATDAYLSFQIRYKSESCLDRLQVEVSTTGVTGTYTPICTRNTIRETRGSLGGNPAITNNSDGWVREIVDLKNYVGNTNMSLRFRFLSNGTSRAAFQTDGFNIDNIQIVKTTAVPLPVRFEDLAAYRQGDHVMLQWKAFVEGQFAYYQVERSPNAESFTAIGKITDSRAASFVDREPLLGNNYYRIKAVDMDGTVRYSKIVLIIFQPNTSFSVYPNPASDRVFVEISSESAQTMRIELISVDGRLVSSQAANLGKGGNKVQVKMPAQAGVMYIIRIKDALGNVVKEQKIMKVK